MRLARAGAVIALALLVTACGSSSTLTAEKEQAFLDEVHGAAPDIAGYRSNSQLVSLGEAVCTDFQSGATVQQVADRVPLYEGQPALPSDDLGAVMAAAVDQLCPKYHGVLGP
ncbi:MAG: DUF732 domain-containing protein [Acidimicrobiales bacterium]